MQEHKKKKNKKAHKFEKSTKIDLRFSLFLNNQLKTNVRPDLINYMLDKLRIIYN